MPEISVIIPTFNAEKTIVETVHSVLSQTFSDFEILVINDGSTDGTLEVLSHIQDPRLAVFTFPNGGVAVSRNRGIQKSSGRFLTFLDSDDLWTPEKLTEQWATLNNHPEAAVAYSWNDYIDETGKFLHHGWHPNFTGDVYEALFQRCFIENGSNIMVRRDAVEIVGEFDPTVVPAEDWDFYLRLAEKYPFVCVPKVHVLYRMVANSLSNRVLRMERSGVSVLKKALKQTPDRVGVLRQSSFEDFYSYLFYRAFQQASTRQHWFITLQVFTRGVFQSPHMWNLVAKRRILRAINGLIFGA
ncbi:glycosyltransferase family 2 protein [Leptolyngbya sp. PCC 6406]|uniref:glycosyltransferase family 2 protein n=1 Tax=Leptolyngbya sp. PCC 6406 TaxID=1173264 RepID=UPI0002ACB481|nr:glycosyltransferase [Leptolyngbya sp. PCC 6406]